ncbi:hypothetical protein EIP86_010675 [Pleurotus ostreatoroseus]|nr:hypothetical protein EIP86_010675 [Pleurotus ostreatoroseus]
MFSKSALIALTTLLVVLSPTEALWPQPRSLQEGTTPLRLSGGFDITISGSVHDAPSDLHAAVESTLNYVKTDKLGRLVVGRGSVDAAAVSKAKTLSKLTLSLSKGATAHSITSEAQKAPEDRDEAYTLVVPNDGSSATLTANSTLGLFRGLTTFSQLFFYNSGSTYLLNAPVRIEDSPAYPYRGFMLDTARNFFPVADIKRTLDAMSWVKINQFHWHVVDSQSFPLEVPGFMDLSQKGAYDSVSVYSPADVADIVSYAGARGIDVLIEIDTPGHTSVISKAHPEFIACAESTPWATYANEPPAGQLRLASSTVTHYTADLLAAVAKMFPSTLFSTGGDELNTNCYDDDLETQQDLQSSSKTLEEALDTFTQTTHNAIIAEGKTPVVWEG